MRCTAEHEHCCTLNFLLHPEGGIRIASALRYHAYAGLLAAEHLHFLFSQVLVTLTEISITLEAA